MMSCGREQHDDFVQTINYYPRAKVLKCSHILSCLRRNFLFRLKEVGIRADGSRVLSSESLFMVCASRSRAEQCPGKMIGNVTGLSRVGGMKNISVVLRQHFRNPKEGNMQYVDKCGKQNS